MNWAAVDSIRSHYFKEVAGFSDVNLEVPVLKGQLDNRDFGARGTWKHTSPTEIIMAFMAAVAEDIAGGKSVEELQEWRHQMLSAPCLFVLLDKDSDIEWRSQQLREDISQKSNLARTCVQRIFDVNQRRFAHGVRVTPDTMVKLYHDNLRLSEKSEPITKSWVDCAFTIWDRAMSRPSIQAIVLEEEAFLTKSMFNNVYKMQAIVSKAQTPADIEWVFAYLHDHHLSGDLTSEQCSLRFLQGSPRVDNGKGFADLIVFKHRFLQYLLDEIVSKAHLDDGHRMALRDICSSHARFRAHVGYGEHRAQASPGMVALVVGLFHCCFTHGWLTTAGQELHPGQSILSSLLLKPNTVCFMSDHSLPRFVRSQSLKPNAVS